MNPHDAHIDIRLRPPGYGPEIGAIVEISAIEWDEAFRPLPRDREIYPPSMRCAEEMEVNRQRLAQDISKHLAAMLAHRLESAILEALRKKDTVNGYPREQWDAMQA